MSRVLDDQISRAKELAWAEDERGAMSLAAELVEQYPDEMKVWWLRGYLHSRNQHYSEAVADLTRAIEINPLEPVLFFDKGRDELALGNDQSAANDFSRGLELCDRYNNNYYRETLYFMRASALLRLGKKPDALEDLAHVNDNFSAWTDRLQSKFELLAECRR